MKEDESAIGKAIKKHSRQSRTCNVPELGNLNYPRTQTGAGVAGTQSSEGTEAQEEVWGEDRTL